MEKVIQESDISVNYVPSWAVLLQEKMSPFEASRWGVAGEGHLFSLVTEDDMTNKFPLHLILCW